MSDNHREEGLRDRGQQISVGPSNTSETKNGFTTMEDDVATNSEQRSRKHARPLSFHSDEGDDGQWDPRLLAKTRTASDNPLAMRICQSQRRDYGGKSNSLNESRLNKAIEEHRFDTNQQHYDLFGGVPHWTTNWHGYLKNGDMSISASGHKLSDYIFLVLFDNEGAGSISIWAKDIKDCIITPIKNVHEVMKPFQPKA
ncbi:hypothetical protein HJFPF1_01291 [Paramyrothecium foliicola]|nr:hypothetical protein HJFPF1_01291 [Paramyrothecium foliicola]